MGFRLCLRHNGSDKQEDNGGRKEKERGLVKILKVFRDTVHDNSRAYRVCDYVSTRDESASLGKGNEKPYSSAAQLLKPISLSTRRRRELSE